MLRREHVDDRHRAVLGELLQGRLVAAAHAQGREVSREHDRGVAQRLAARCLQLVGAQHDRVAAKLADADLEGHAGAGGGLLEDEPHAATAQRLRGERRALEL